MRRRIYEMIEKGEQEDKISLYYDRFMIFCIIASVLPLCVKNSTNPVFYRIDRITVFIFIIDYLLRWGTADFKLKGEKPFLRYPFTFFAVVDLIAILSSLTPLYSTLKAVRILRLPTAVLLSHSFPRKRKCPPRDHNSLRNRFRLHSHNRGRQESRRSHRSVRGLP